MSKAQKDKQCKDCKYLRQWGYDHVCYNYQKSLSGFITSPYHDACDKFEKKEKSNGGE